jgi:lipoprotein-anchoring transpeptidase ErfK/SrfK
MKFKLSVTLFTFLTALTIFLAQGGSAWAAGPLTFNQTNPASHPATGDILCLPGIYDQAPGDCLPAGPSAYLSDMAHQGVTFPIKPLPAAKPDTALTYIDYRYGEVRNSPAPVFGSIEDALKGNKKNAIRSIDSSFSYISYTEDAVVDGKRFYQVDPGAWMTANDISRIGVVPLFQGMEFTRTPDNAFGWALQYMSNGPIETKRTPGMEQNDYTGHVLNHQEVIQVYDVQQAGDQDWYMVGPGEWVPDRVIARVIPNSTPPEGVTSGRWIEVNLYEQTLAVYDNYQLVFATLIASGVEPFWTRPGLFQIFEKLNTTPMRGSFEADHSDAYYLEDVPWTMYFDKARALHGAYWRANLGFPQSHGCVNLTVGDSHWLYDWAQLGDYVYVWDPSGKTPTDPSKYTGGGY